VRHCPLHPLLLLEGGGWGDGGYEALKPTAIFQQAPSLSSELSLADRKDLVCMVLQGPEKLDGHDEHTILIWDGSTNGFMGTPVDSSLPITPSLEEIQAALRSLDCALKYSECETIQDLPPLLDEIFRLGCEESPSTVSLPPTLTGSTITQTNSPLGCAVPVRLRVEDLGPSGLIARFQLEPGNWIRIRNLKLDFSSSIVASIESDTNICKLSPLYRFLILFNCIFLILLSVLKTCKQEMSQIW
jgi:hypothetical protein